MPPNTIPAMPIHDWCNRLSNQAPASHPINAAEGSRIAICISFSACTSVSIPLEVFERGLESGMGRLKGMEAPVQHTVPTGKRVYFPFGLLPS